MQARGDSTAMRPANTHSMRYYTSWGLITILALIVACSTGNATALSRAPEATRVREACLDFNGDHRLNDADAADLRKVPDFDGNGKRDDQDAALIRGLDIPLDPDREHETCVNKPSNIGPEFFIAHPAGKAAPVDCSSSRPAFLLFGVGGGIVNLDDKSDAAGVRSMIDGLQRAYEDRGAQTIAVIAGPLMDGAAQVHGGAELFLTHAATVLLERYPCMRAVFLGHSHGAVSVDVVSSHLEGQYADRVVDVVDVDRHPELYTGDTTSRPTRVHVFNIYQTNDGSAPGTAYDASNAENWDASSEQAPENGDKGGALKPVSHTTIDNSEAVKQRIVSEEVARARL